MEKQKATHEIVGIGKGSAHHVDRHSLRKKRGWFGDTDDDIGKENRTSSKHTAGWFKFVNPFNDCPEIFSNDIKVRRL